MLLLLLWVIRGGVWRKVSLRRRIQGRGGRGRRREVVHVRVREVGLVVAVAVGHGVGAEAEEAVVAAAGDGWMLLLLLGRVEIPAACYCRCAMVVWRGGVVVVAQHGLTICNSVFKPVKKFRIPYINCAYMHLCFLGVRLLPFLLLSSPSLLLLLFLRRHLRFCRCS